MKRTVRFLMGVIFLCGITGFAAEPSKDGLQLWVKVDDFKNRMEGEPLLTWPDASGKKNDLKAEVATAPTYQDKGLAGKPVVAFKGVHKAVNQFFNIPISGEWEAMTFIAVGTKLNNAGLLDTAPWTDGCFRLIGFEQLTGSKLGCEQPFAAMDEKQFNIVTVTIGRDAGKLATLTNFTNGRQSSQYVQKTGEKPERPVLFKTPKIGCNNGGNDTSFNGEVSEILLYDRALSEKERKDTEAYLAGKYGLKLTP